MRIGRVAILLGLGLFAIAAAASGLDRISLRNAAVGRLVPAPFRAQADRSAAAVDLARRKDSAALRHATAAVARDPVDPDSTALLGAALLARKDEDRAAEAFRIAARFGWRNLATQIYWFDAAVQAGDYRVAGDRADAILRTHPSFPEKDTLFAALETVPRGREILLDHLASRPPWFYRYLEIDAATPQDVVQRRADVIEALGKSNRSLGCKSVFGVSQALMLRGERELAARVWNSNCGRLAVGKGLSDPGFEFLDSDERTPFGWTVDRSGEVGVDLVRAPDGGKEISISNRASNARIAIEQQVSLPPGQYRLTGKVRTDRPGEAGSVVASLGCDSQAPFPVAPVGSLAQGGQIIEAGHCGTHRLALWLLPGSGPVRLDAMTLEPVR